MVVVSIKKIFSTTQLEIKKHWNVILVLSFTRKFSQPLLWALSESDPHRTKRPATWRLGVEILDSALNNYEEFTICGRVMNYNFKRSSSTVWHRIVSSDDSMYLLVALAIDCEDIYNACTNHYKHYIGKVIKMSESLTLNMIKIE